LGFLRAYSIFDVSRITKSGKIFLLDEHYNRIKYSVKEIGLKFPLSKKEFEEIIYKLMKKNKVKKTVIRTIVSGGIGENGFLPKNKENILILLEKFVSLKKQIFEKGVSVVTFPYNREIPNIKTTNYLKVLINQKNRIKSKAFETLYVNNGRLYEGSTANVFIIKNKKIYTPKEGVLPGTTRNLLIKLLKEENIKVYEENITEKQLFNADEVFLTATNKNILPVTKIDDKLVDLGIVGDITKKLMLIYKNFEDNY